MGVKLAAASGGSIELVPTNTASNFTVTVPAATGTMALQNGTGVGKVLQVVSAVSTSTISTTSATTVITASITPSSATSKVMTFFAGEINSVPTANSYGFLSLTRPGSNLGGISQVGVNTAIDVLATGAKNYLDSPATTSPITYTLSVGKGSGSTASASALAGTSITLMEIAA
jgi:hypothetical protein